MCTRVESVAADFEARIDSNTLIKKATSPLKIYASAAITIAQNAQILTTERVPVVLVVVVVFFFLAIKIISF